MKLLLVVLLSGCALSAPLHSINERDVSHLLPPSTSYGVPDTRIVSGPYPPAAPVQEYGPPHDDTPIAEPSNEYGPPRLQNEYLPPPPPPPVPSLPEIVVTHPYPPQAEPVKEYGPPAVQHDIVAPVEQYGPPAEAAQDSVAVGPYPPPSFDSRYGAPTH